jgi:hypothetical protein
MAIESPIAAGDLALGVPSFEGGEIYYLPLGNSTKPISSYAMLAKP